VATNQLPRAAVSEEAELVRQLSEFAALRWAGLSVPYTDPMPVVRLPRVEAILGAPIDQLTIEHIQAAAAAGVEESRDLDFKNDHYDKRNDGGDELAKDTDVSDGSELMIFVGPITARSRNSSLPIIGGQPAHLATTSSCKARCGAPSRSINPTPSNKSTWMSANPPTTITNARVTFSLVTVAA
jgi:hypothetical protein